jgi:hypothetical protein
MYEEDIDFVLKRYKDLFGFDLFYMRFKVDSQPVHIDGSPCHELDPDECGGDCTRLGWIRLNPDMRSVMRRYGVDGDVKEFTRVIIAHELAHELWNSVVGENFKQDVLSKAESENFNTPYLETVSPSKLREETFCEWMANEVAGAKSIDFPEGEVESLRGRDVIVTHRVSDDFQKFHKGDAVRTSWGDEYEVVGRDEIDDVSDSPYAEELTPGQYRFLSGYSMIAVLTLRRKKARNGLEFRQVLDGGGELKSILRGMPSYADNPRLNMFQFEKYLTDDSAFATLWYGCFDGSRCMSLAVLKRYHDDGVILLAEVQSAVKGYGQPLIENILSRSRNIWWCADPDGGESLVEYYRQFGVNEYLIRKSKWVGNRPEYAFYKVEDPEHERIILNTLRRADACDSLYKPAHLRFS